METEWEDLAACLLVLSYIIYKRFEGWIIAAYVSEKPGQDLAIQNDVPDALKLELPLLHCEIAHSGELKHTYKLSTVILLRIMQ